MKKAKKALALVLCAVLLVAGSVMGTLAYLTSTDTVTNTFTVGNVAITLDETDVDNSTSGASSRDKANGYKLLPGHTYTKDPIIHVASNSENCYLFVKVVNEIAAIEDQTDTVASQMDENGWEVVDSTNGIYVYIGDGTSPCAVSAGDNKTVFTNFKIDGGVTNTVLAGYEGKTIVVTAYAIQADGFDGKDAEYIWNASGFGA